MVFVRSALFPGGTQAHYDALAAELVDAEVPTERLAFLAGPVPDGWQVIQVWASADDLRRFNERWLLPAMERLGPQVFPAGPLVQDFEAIDFVLGG